MIRRKLKSLSFDDESIASLKAISQETGMNESEVVRMLIKKASIDKKTRQIITDMGFDETAKKRLLGRTSHNVQYDNNEKDPAGTESMTDSLTSRLNSTVESQIKQYWERNAGENANQVFMLLDTVELEEVAYEDWHQYTIGKLKNLAREKIQHTIEEAKKRI